MPEYTYGAVMSARKQARNRRQMADRLGCSVHTVDCLINRFDLSRFPAGSGHIGQNTKYTEAVVREADTVATSVEDFAARLGCSTNYAYMLRKRYGLNTMGQRRRATHAHQSRLRLRRALEIAAYLNKGHTFEEAAKQYSVSRQRISRILQCEGIGCRYVYYHPSAWPLQFALAKLYIREKALRDQDAKADEEPKTT